MNVLLIGGSGHVSGALSRAALAQGHDVWAVTRGQRPMPEGVTPLTCDRHDITAFEAAISGANTTWDLAVDCIGYAPDDVARDIALLRERAKHFVFVSTDFVYDPARRRFPQPEAPACYVDDGEGSPGYGHRKRLSELKLIESDTGDMTWTVVRPCHIYGPTSELGCLPLHGRDVDLIAKMRAGEPITLIGGGHFLQQPILARDLAELILSTAGNGAAEAGIFNSAGPDIIESRAYYEIIADVLGVEAVIADIPVHEFLAQHPESASFACHRIYDLTRMRECGLKAPSTPIDVGLREHVESLLARKEDT